MKSAMILERFNRVISKGRDFQKGILSNRELEENL
jgi:hypothetical protein